MENRTNLNITNEKVKLLEAIKTEFGLRSHDAVIGFLLDLKKDAKIDKKYKCEKCGEIVKISDGTNPTRIGLRHSHVTERPCDGCIKINYVFNRDDKTNGTTTASDKNRTQTDAKDFTKFTEEERKECIVTIEKFNRHILTQEERDNISPRSDAYLTEKYHIPKTLL